MIKLTIVQYYQNYPLLDTSSWRDKTFLASSKIEVTFSPVCITWTEKLQNFNNIFHEKTKDFISNFVGMSYIVIYNFMTNIK